MVAQEEEDMGIPHEGLGKSSPFLTSYMSDKSSLVSVMALLDCQLDYVWN